MAQEKTITVNLVKTFAKPKTKRAKSALHFLKQAVTKETRMEKVKISNGVNETMWERGLFNCPRKITVKIILEKDEARVYLPEEKIENKKTEKKETNPETTKKEEIKKTEDKPKEKTTQEETEKKDKKETKQQE